MSPEEEEVALVVESRNLAATELGQWRKELSPHATDSVTEERGETVEDELG